VRKFNSSIRWSILAIGLLFSACGAQVKTLATWVNKENISSEPYKSIFIMVLTDNMNVKTILEHDLSVAAKERGLKVSTSIDAFGPIGLSQVSNIKDILTKKLETLGCETVFFVALKDKQSETRYVPGNSISYSPYGGYGPYGAYGTYGGYYGYGFSMGYYSPGYYTTDKTYFIESNLYDAKTEKLLVSIQSKAVNPDVIEKSSQTYTKSLMFEIDKIRRTIRE
jgi:hypothetical protein